MLSSDTSDTAPIVYVVRAMITNPEIVVPWLQWLHGEHIEEVFAAGALSAEVMRDITTKNSHLYEIRYRFRDQESFHHYQETHAPQLQERGRFLFPAELGIKYTRSIYQHIADYIKEEDS